MIKIKLSDLKVGNVIRANIVPFTQRSEADGSYFLTKSRSKGWAKILKDVTMTIAAIGTSPGGWIQLHTAEYGKIDTWVDIIDSVKCYTIKYLADKKKNIIKIIK